MQTTPVAHTNRILNLINRIYLYSRSSPTHVIPGAVGTLGNTESRKIKEIVNNNAINKILILN